ncbi:MULTISPECIES: hypothetical protein [Halorussus]|uniref:hypothetical protein n=1 Tax=Halorussus TaxID=1070314 RepID=UPI00209F0D3D|nr:hypothetical protein [Halorussus vallis]USZ77744.1 hypothetical protein NGM07_00400 [Halorussus vallis]
MTRSDAEERRPPDERTPDGERPPSGESAVEPAETGTTDRDGTDDHLTEVPDGSGCTEIWEHLSERRDGNDGDE